MNYIDIFSRGQIAGLIQKYSPTMLLVEHDRAFAISGHERQGCKYSAYVKSM